LAVLIVIQVKYSSTEGVRLFGISSYVQDGGDVVISRRKVLPSDECTRSVCPTHMQQRPLIPDPQYIMYICICL